MDDSYGDQQWWPADTRFEIMVGAILVQATSWSNVESAIDALEQEDLLHPNRLRDVDETHLAKLIKASVYFNAKARKLKALSHFLGDGFGDDISLLAKLETYESRRLLLGVHGIGPETADDILLYALGKPVFVVDTYTIRLFGRLGVMQPNLKYHDAQSIFMNNLCHDVSMFGQYHALIVRHSVDHCRKKPLCHGCPLLSVCDEGRRQTAS